MVKANGLVSKDFGSGEKKMLTNFYVECDN